MTQANPTSFGIVLPFYNEERYLGRTLESLRHQKRTAEQVILVDNGSTDKSAEIAAEFCRSFGPMARLIAETTPGKVHALRSGCALIEQEWVVTCDADTFYPPHYLALAEQMVEQRRSTKQKDSTVALFAIGVPEEDGLRAPVIEGRLALARRFPGKCFTGGFGQIFRTDVLGKVGGFDADIWPYVLMDHEIVHRVSAHGSCAYDRDFWCCPSDRRSDRSAVRWGFTERWMYRNVPRALEGWFFYSFLAKRFSKRGLRHLNLREKSWKS